jgi:hypothetical protein
MKSGAFGAALTLALALEVWAEGPIRALAPGIVPLVLLVFIAAAAACSGRRVLRALKPIGLDELETTVAGATLGLGLLSLGTFALAACGILKAWTASALLGAAWLAGWPELAPALDSIAAGARAARARPWLCALIVLPLAAALWACLAPPHQYDSLVYHLALPQEYLRTASLRAPDGIVYAHFPQNGEMLFSLALALGSDLLAQMLVWLATALTIGWLVTFGRRLTPAAPWAAVLVATHTAVLTMSSTTYVEPIVMLWTTACLLSFETSDEGRERGLLLAAAAFAGLALGTKYYAGLLAAAVVLRLVWRERLKAAVLFAGVAVALFAPWLIKNWICVGNPVFPFLYRVFPATKIGWTSDLAAGYFQVLTEYGHTRGFWRDLLALPVLLFRDPLRYGGGMDVLGDLGWDLTLWLWPLGLWAAWKGRGPRGLAALTVLYAVGWFSTGVVLRFLTALAPALALVGAAGVADWRSRAGFPARFVAAAAAGALIAAHLFLFFYVHGVFGTAEALLALESREVFLSKRLDYYACAAFASDSLGPRADVLVIGEQRGYYLAVPHRATTVHAPNLYVTRANEAASPRELADALRADGFTHLLLVPREAARLRDGVGAFTERGTANWLGLESGLKTVFRGPACLVAALEAP